MKKRRVGEIILRIFFSFIKLAENFFFFFFYSFIKNKKKIICGKSYIFIQEKKKVFLLFAMCLFSYLNGMRVKVIIYLMSYDSRTNVGV